MFRMGMKIILSQDLDHITNRSELQYVGEQFKLLRHSLDSLTLETTAQVFSVLVFLTDPV